MSPAAAKIKIGIVGGTGFYNMPQLENKSVVENIRTEFGPPSSDIVTGTIDGVDCAVLARSVRTLLHFFFPRNTRFLSF